MPACAALDIVGLLMQPKLRCYLCTYNNDMNIEFDPAKDAANFVKHGVSLTLAAEIEWSKVLCTPDSRRDYGEVREIGFAVIARRLYVVVFVQRGPVMRIISLRKANSREVKLYDQAS